MNLSVDNHRFRDMRYPSIIYYKLRERLSLTQLAFEISKNKLMSKMWSLIRQHQFVSGTQCVLLSKQENIKVPLFDSETPPIQDQSDSENVGGKGCNL
ncbi:hypothetical protein Prudu_001977 [Prunus dulcis]|uniref:Uncharacterized protein n=1 Tax=Prunus dulcis TaxID=3755 RepID=A0A4Y1QPQ8_PRUDU|nr:hypothetical protein Prudu_001977 [Prunus dulcis]